MAGKTSFIAIAIVVTLLIACTKTAERPSGPKQGESMYTLQISLLEDTFVEWASPTKAFNPFVSKGVPYRQTITATKAKELIDNVIAHGGPVEALPGKGRVWSVYLKGPTPSSVYIVEIVSVEDDQLLRTESVKDGGETGRVSNSRGLILEPTKAYAAIVEYDSETSTWWPVEGIRVPYHHAARIEWTNLEHFSELVRRRGERVKLEFTVVKKDMQTIQKHQQVRTTYYCEILNIK